MKKLYKSFTLLIACLFFSQGITAQNCSGTPGSNSITPATPSVCSGGSLTLGLANSYSVNGITYQWSSSMVSQVGPFSTIQGATMNTYATPPLTSNTFYQVVITCSFSGQSFTVNTAVVVALCATSVGKLSLSSEPVLVYPNPVSGILMIKGLKKDGLLSLFDINGKLVFSAQISATKNNVNIENLPTGIYEAVIKSDNEVKKFKIVKD